MGAGEGGGVGRPVGGLDPVHPAAGGDEVERADEVVQRAELEAGAVGRGRHHAGHRLGVVPAHLREREVLVGEVLVELADAHPGLDAHERLVAVVAAHAIERERVAQPVGAHEVARRQRDVRPRVPRSDRPHGGFVGLGGAHDLLQLGERRGAVDPQRLDPLVARVVAPALALLELHAPSSSRRAATSARSSATSRSSRSRRSSSGGGAAGGGGGGAAATTGAGASASSPSRCP